MGQLWPLFCFISVFSNKQYNFYNKSMWKNVQTSIQYMAPGFKPTTFQKWVVTHNYWTRATAQKTDFTPVANTIEFIM